MPDEQPGMRPEPDHLRPVVRAAAFIERGGAVLLIRQSKGPATYWLLPGGRVDRGESLADTVIRELEEELGIHVSPRTPPLGLIESIPPTPGSGKHSIMIIFAADLAPGEEPRPADPAVQECRWATAGELQELKLHPPIQDILAGWLREPRGPGREAVAPFTHPAPRWAD
ncbi:MAG: NUDIX hydrolase [Gemmatimonadetes bacterium]|nr:NUDIX hydrolase [Thermoleophilia bacterium]NJD19671.1 NUDIX hydrolase [Gemmatimonadota bacterium]